MDSTSGIQQLVVIAKPGPDQPYCQLATAFQSCWCQRSILHACLNALNAFSDERHRIGILQELAFAAETQVPKVDLKLSADDYYQTDEQKDADCRFPYITATLVSNMVCCVGDNTNHQCALEAPVHAVTARADDEPIYADCYTKSVNGRRSVDYICVIDITDLSHLRYCFLAMQELFCVKCGLGYYHPGMKTTQTRDDVLDMGMPEYEMADYTPSSGEPLSYRIDFDSNGDLGPFRPEKDVKAFEMLQAYPLIDVATLEDCWPSAAWKEAGLPVPDAVQVSHYTSAQKRGAKPLSKLAQDKILDAVLLGLLDDLKLLDDPMLFRGFPKSFLATCAARADELAASKYQHFIAAIIALLLEGEPHVDLYPFRQLPAGTIREILRSDRLRDMKSLNLSGHFVGSPWQIWTTLDAIAHKPEVVYILSPPSVNRATERIETKNTVPHYLAGWESKFWDRVGSMRIVMSASISTALTSYASPNRFSSTQWELTYLNYLRELAQGDTNRLRMWPWMWWGV